MIVALHSEVAKNIVQKKNNAGSRYYVDSRGTIHACVKGVMSRAFCRTFSQQFSAVSLDELLKAQP